jgi:hypothetical protein
MLKTDKTPIEAFYELCYYTCSHPDPSFIHQHAVDAFAAQYADEDTKNITLIFGLIGLYLYLEKNFTGKEVQNAHITLGKYRKNWPRFELPEDRGDITVYHVISTPKNERDEAIRRWCDSVWEAYSHIHNEIALLVSRELWR